MHEKIRLRIYTKLADEEGSEGGGEERNRGDRGNKNPDFTLTFGEGHKTVLQFCSGPVDQLINNYFAEGALAKF